MNNERRIFFSIAVYCLLLIVLSAVSVSFVKRSASLDFGTEIDEQTLAEEIVYVPVFVESESESGEESTLQNEIFTLKSYKGKIGIFDSSAKLIDVIEVYVKTLPSTDRRMLEEGIEVSGREALISAIEDYTG